MAGGGRKPPSGVRLRSGGEFDLIRKLLSEGPLQAEGVSVGAGDDGVVLDVAASLVLSADLTIEHVHFERAWLDLSEVGYRATAGALSDLAAMAARPLGVMVSLAVPGSESAEVAPAIQIGVREACRHSGAVVLGGDLTASPGPIVLDIVVVGRTERPMTRAGARPGDALWVTGVLGGAAGAVAAWREGRAPAAGLRKAFARPTPRIEEALWLKGAGASALIDLSDGLGGDAGHVAAASDVAIVLEEASLPLHPELPSGDAVDLALSGGEDYELLASAPAGALDGRQDAFLERFGIPLTRVGTVGRGAGVAVLRTGAVTPEPLEHGGFDHFERER